MPFGTSGPWSLTSHAVQHDGEIRYPMSMDGLTSYVTNLMAMFRQVGTYTGRFLHGAKPAGGDSGDTIVLHANFCHLHQFPSRRYVAAKFERATGRLSVVRRQPTMPVLLSRA